MQQLPAITTRLSENYCKRHLFEDGLRKQNYSRIGTLSLLLPLFHFISFIVHETDV